MTELTGRTRARKAQRVNPDRVLGLMLGNVPMSRSDLARELKLSRAAVTALIQEFCTFGIVEDNIATVSRSGRKAIGIQLNLVEFYMVAVRINRREVTFRLYNGLGEAIATDAVSIEPGVKIEQLLELIIGSVNALIEGRSADHFLGVSISSLGWLFERQGEIRLHTDGFSELGRRDIRAEVQAKFPGVPVVLEHDAKTSALAEYQDYVRGTGVKPVCLLNIVGGIGFGAGIVIEGKIFRGSTGLAGEVGHLGINFNSTIHTRHVDSTEFSGLFEDYASPRALQQNVSDRLLEFPDSPLTEVSTPDEIYAAFEANDALAVWAINRMCRLTAYGLAGLVFVLNPDVIVLGDRFPVSVSILERTRSYLADYLPSVLMDSLELKVSDRGMDGVLYGSFLLLMRWYLSREALYARIRQAHQRRNGIDQSSKDMAKQVIFDTVGPLPVLGPRVGDST